MQDNVNYSYISTIIDTDETTHYIKDAEARQAIDGLEDSKQDKIDSTHKLPASNVSGLSSVATSGSYNDLIDKPIADSAMSDSSINPVQNKVVKAYVDAIVASIESVLKFKGTKQTVAEIKAIASAHVGDVWICAADNSEWVCIEEITSAKESAWEEFGPIIDLSAYELKANLHALAYKDSVSASYTPAGSVTVNNYTPEGDISTPSISVAVNDTTVNSIASVGTLPEFEANVANETLTFSFNKGTLPVKGNDTTVVTGIKSATSSTPTFTGKAKAPTASFTGTAATITSS